MKRVTKMAWSRVWRHKNSQTPDHAILETRMLAKTVDGEGGQKSNPSIHHWLSYVTLQMAVLMEMISRFLGPRNSAFLKTKLQVKERIREKHYSLLLLSCSISAAF